MYMLVVILKSGEVIKIRMNDDEIIIFGVENNTLISVGIAKTKEADQELAHFDISCLSGYCVVPCDEEGSKKEPDG